MSGIVSLRRLSRPRWAVGLIGVLLIVLVGTTAGSCEPGGKTVATKNVVLKGGVVASVTVVHADGDPSRYTVKLKNTVKQEAKVTLRVYSVGPGGKWAKRAETSGTVQPGKTISVKAAPLKGEWLAVRASASLARGKAKPDVAKLKSELPNARWKSPLDA